MKTPFYDPEPIIEARKRVFGTQQAFADALGRKREIIRRLERGIQTSPDTLRQACDKLGLSMEINISPPKKT